MNLKDFKLKSYTTKVPAGRSLIEIEVFLMTVGATAITKEFKKDGEVENLIFKIDNKGFRLPLNTDGVEVLLFSEPSRMKQSDKRKKSYRVACRILREWTHAQLSLVVSGQAQPDQVMLPYLYDGKQTMYEMYKNNQLKLENKCDVEVLK